MIRLHMLVEGQSEQRFVQDVLKPRLAHFNVFSDVRCLGARGRMSSYAKITRDIRIWMQEDARPDCRFTTMVDLYALPNDFPGYVDAARKRDPYERVACLEGHLAQNIQDSRFIPYIQLHEFETLLFADPQKLDWEYLEHDAAISNLLALLAQTPGRNPELINDGPKTAPSKRIKQEIPEYDKVTAGVFVIKKIGLQTLRQQCRHFHEWVSCLENLAGRAEPGP